MVPPLPLIQARSTFPSGGREGGTVCWRASGARAGEAACRCGRFARIRHPPGYGAAREAVSRIPSRPPGRQTIFNEAYQRGFAPPKLVEQAPVGVGHPPTTAAGARLGAPAHPHPEREKGEVDRFRWRSRTWLPVRRAAVACHRESTPAPGCDTTKGVFRGDVGRAFLPGPSWHRTRPPRGRQRESGGRGPAKCRIYYIPPSGANSILPARRRRDHAATATCNLTGDTGDLPLHRVDSLALLGSGIRAVILEPAGSNNQNQTLQPNDALFHPPLQGLEILTMP